MKWDAATIQTAVAKFVQTQGRLPVAREMNPQNGLPTCRTFEKIIRMSWGNYAKCHYPELAKLGEERHKQRVLDIRKEQSEWTNEKLMVAVERFIEQHHRLPLMQEFTSENQLPSYTTFRKIAEQVMIGNLQSHFAEQLNRGVTRKKEDQTMGCWGITAFESDAGLDAVDYIRHILPEDGELDLGTVIEALKADDVRLPDTQDAESHSSPMALAEIIVKLVDHDMDSLDYDDEYFAGERKFSDLTSFSASKESLRWLRDYLIDTLQSARQWAGREGNWNGWFEEKNWIGWQEHMATLVGRLDGLLAEQGYTIDLLTVNQPENGQTMKM